MSNTVYDIYFKGQIADRANLDAVKRNFAKLFKRSPEAVEPMFSGKPCALKKNLSREDAVKYQNLFKKAGAVIHIKAHEGTAEADSTGAEAPAAEPAAAPAARPSAVQSTAPAAARPAAPAANSDSFDLCPTGADILTEDERSHVEAPDIDISALQMESIFAPVENIPREQGVAPDTSHISIADVGADLAEPGDAPPIATPDISGMSVAEPGLLESIPDERQKLNPDTSGMSMAEAGSDLSEGVEKSPPPPPPDTTHIHLDKD